MKYPKRIFRNYILPLMILIPLISIMVGCIYIPTWDHTLLVGTKKDFRGWANDHKNTPPPQLAIITRSAIEAMFGKPAFESSNGNCVAYVMGTEHNIIVWPLCFGAGFAEGDAQVLKLVYDKDGHLKKFIPLSTYRRPAMHFFGNSVGSWGEPEPESRASPMNDAEYMIRDANRRCPPDEIIEMPLQ